MFHAPDNTIKTVYIYKAGYLRRYFELIGGSQSLKSNVLTYTCFSLYNITFSRSLYTCKYPLQSLSMKEYSREIEIAQQNQNRRKYPKVCVNLQIDVNFEVNSKSQTFYA